MKHFSETELDYNGISEQNLANQQLDIAVKAFHVIAVLHNGNPEFMANIAIETLREMEKLAHLYDEYPADYN